MNYALQPLKKYADFSGRARRKEFWLYYLCFMVATIIVTIFDMVVGTYDYQYSVGLFYVIFSLGVFIPTLAVSVRRLHDTERGGWW